MYQHDCHFTLAVQATGETAWIKATRLCIFLHLAFFGLLPTCLRFLIRASLAELKLTPSPLLNVGKFILSDKIKRVIALTDGAFGIPEQLSERVQMRCWHTNHIGSRSYR